MIDSLPVALGKSVEGGSGWRYHPHYRVQSASTAKLVGCLG